MNIAYDSEKFGLKELYNIDHADCYEFDTLMIWQHEDGTLYYAQDSGCSCPTPFEEYKDLKDLNVITNDTFYNFKECLKNHRGVDMAEFLEVSAEIEKLLKKQKQKLEEYIQTLN